MSRFVNARATERVVLGDCDCPGKPHDEDWIDLRSELGAQDIITISGGSSIDALQVLAVDWNLLDHDGTTAPIDRDHLERLTTDTPVFDKLAGWVTKHTRVALPNVTGARSGNGSSGSASPSLTIPTRQ